MSSHFNYEIEERNMRNQLKGLEVPFKNDAWHSYEDYAKQFQHDHKAQLLPNFNFALNRTVVLPVVFGAIIILFSFLLFNFINIKNNKPAKTEVSEIKQPIKEIQKPGPKKQVVATVKKEELQKPEVVTPTAAIAPTNTTETTVAKILPATETKTLAVKPAAINTAPQITQVTTTTTNTFEPKKKRRKKNSVEVLESIATPASLPTIAQEEAEPELR